MTTPGKRTVFLMGSMDNSAGRSSGLMSDSCSGLII
jgi:hypothetical protein